LHRRGKIVVIDTHDTIKKSIAVVNDADLVTVLDDFHVRTAT